jgi:multiple antibiotic resistance protein
MENFVSALIVFFVVVDPLGLVPVYIALTRDFPDRQRRMVAVRGSAIGFAIIVFFAYFGEMVLSALSIEMPAFRISGGALLFWIAFEMLFIQRSVRRERSVDHDVIEQEARDISVFPVAIPLISGPGAITSTLLLMDRYGTTVGGQATVLLAAALVTGGVAVLLILADQVQRLFGRTLIYTVSRGLGLVLAALATQTIISGVLALYPPH